MNNSKIKSFTKKYNLLVLCSVIFIIWALFASLTGGGYLSARNLSNLFRQMSIIGIMSVGMSFVIITGNVDLSVGSQLGLLGAVSAISIRTGIPLYVVVPITLLSGALLGLFNGWWYAYRGVPAFIVTLAGLLVYRGIVLYITKGTTIPVSNEAFNLIGGGFLPNYVGVVFLFVSLSIYILAQFKKRQSQKKYNQPPTSIKYIVLNIAVVLIMSSTFIFFMNSYRGLPIPVLILFIILIIAYYVAENTVYGRTVYAIGGNSEAARYSGINIRRISMLVFMFNGLITGIASLINTARLASAVPSTGVNSELDAIGACVIGGLSLVGGRGSILGALLGSMIIASINNGMSYIGLDSAWQSIIKGLVLLFAVWADIATKNQK